jgi:hypothetical protein
MTIIPDPSTRMCLRPCMACSCEAGKIDVQTCGGLRRWSAHLTASRRSRRTTGCGAGRRRLVGAARTCRDFKARRCGPLTVMPVHMGVLHLTLHRHVRRRWGELCMLASGRQGGAACTAAAPLALPRGRAQSTPLARHARLLVPVRAKDVPGHAQPTAQVAPKPHGEGGTAVALSWPARDS